MNRQKAKNEKIARRTQRTRAKLTGTSERPRLCVHRTNRYIYAQLIDDSKHATILSATQHEIKGEKKTKTQMAEMIGELISKKASEKGIKAAIFDRGSYRYHGRVKALAEGVRKGGLNM